MGSQPVGSEGTEVTGYEPMLLDTRTLRCWRLALRTLRASPVDRRAIGRMTRALSPVAKIGESCDNGEKLVIALPRSCNAAANNTILQN
jgi:hypothetical protein